MAGTLGGALAARGIGIAPDKLKTKVEADIEQVERMIVLSRVRLAYDLTVPRGKRTEAERAVQVHHHGCPIYQSFQRGIQVEWTANITEE
jgi:organic hydroperoxide reductase OsmC/OhrA